MEVVFSNLWFRPATGPVLLFFHPRRCYTLDEMLSLCPTEDSAAIIFGLSSNDSEKASSPPKTTKFSSFFLFFLLSFSTLSASWTEREKERKRDLHDQLPSFFLRMRIFIDLDNPRCKYFISSILKYILTRQTSVLFINTQILNKIFHIFHYFENWREKEIHLFQSKRSRSRVEPSSYHDNFKFSRIIRKIIRLPNHLST